MSEEEQGANEDEHAGKDSVDGSDDEDSVGSLDEEEEYQGGEEPEILRRPVDDEYDSMKGTVMHTRPTTATYSSMY